MTDKEKGGSPQLKKFTRTQLLTAHVSLVIRLDQIHGAFSWYLLLLKDVNYLHRLLVQSQAQKQSYIIY
jgi:hypothetical protein